MLTESEIDPFDSQETKPYVYFPRPSLSKHLELELTVPILSLSDTRMIVRLPPCKLSYKLINDEMFTKPRRSYEVKPKLAFLLFFPSRLTSLCIPLANRETIMGDPFIREYIDDVLRSLRTQWILDIIKPYNRIEISYLARVRRLLRTSLYTYQY